MRALAAVLPIISGCTLYFDDHQSKPPPEPAPAERVFEKLALPVLQKDCMSCHASQPGVDFLAGTTPSEIRQSLLSFQPPIVNLGTPTSSRLLTKGVHTGPAMTAQETSDLLTWIQAERDAAGDPPPRLTTGAFTPILCTAAVCAPDVIDMAMFGVTGKLYFVANATSDGLSLTGIGFTGTASPPLHHLIFVSYPPDGPAVPDPDDQLAGVVVSTSGPLGTGMVNLHGDTLQSISLDFEQ